MSSFRISLRLISDDARALDIAKSYWALDDEGRFVYRVGEIAKTYEISAREVREIANSAAIAESTTESCERCGTVRQYRSRNDMAEGFYPSYRWGGLRLCSSCQNELEQEEERRTRETREKQRADIAAFYEVPEDRCLCVRGLSLEEGIGLLAMIRICGDESLTRINPLRKAAHKLVPSNRYVYELLRSLESSVLWVDPDSSIESFIWDDRLSLSDRYYSDSVSWRVAGNKHELRRIAVELEELFKERDWPELWIQQAPSLQINLAAQELIEYLNGRLNDHHFPFSPGEKTRDIAADMAEHLSIGQGYNLIWGAVKNAASFYVRENCEGNRAAAYAVGILRKSLEQAKTQGWNIKPYKRSWSTPESEMVHLFYRVFHGASDPLTFPPPNPIQVREDSDK